MSMGALTIPIPAGKDGNSGPRQARAPSSTTREARRHDPKFTAYKCVPTRLRIDGPIMRPPRRYCVRFAYRAVIPVFAFCILVSTMTAQKLPVGAVATNCSRECLEGLINQY